MTAITLTLICGGGDSLHAVQPHTVALRKQLRSLADVRYSAEIDSLDLKLFVSGSMDRFSGDGSLEHPRVMKSRRYASGELTMQQAVWKKGARSVKTFLRNGVRDATHTLCARIERAGLEIDTPALLRDIDAALVTFMTSATPKLRPAKRAPAKRKTPKRPLATKKRRR
jgi:hypothetical protein